MTKLMLNFHCHIRKYCIAKKMTKVIVDALETICIDNQESRRQIIGSETVQVVCYALLSGSFVQKAGKIVVLCFMQQGELTLFLLMDIANGAKDCLRDAISKIDKQLDVRPELIFFIRSPKTHFGFCAFWIFMIFSRARKNTV